MRAPTYEAGALSSWYILGTTRLQNLALIRDRRLPRPGFGEALIMVIAGDIGPLCHCGTNAADERQAW